MNLKTKLLLASSAIVLVVLTLSEWIGYRQTGPFLSGHEMRMASEMNHGAVLADLQQGRQRFSCDRRPCTRFTGSSRSLH